MFVIGIANCFAGEDDILDLYSVNPLNPPPLVDYVEVGDSLFYKEVC